MSESFSPFFDAACAAYEAELSVVRTTLEAGTFIDGVVRGIQVILQDKLFEMNDSIFQDTVRKEVQEFLTYLRQSKQIVDFSAEIGTNPMTFESAIFVTYILSGMTSKRALKIKFNLSGVAIEVIKVKCNHSYKEVFTASSYRTYKCTNCDDKFNQDKD